MKTGLILFLTFISRLATASALSDSNFTQNAIDCAGQGPRVIFQDPIQTLQPGKAFATFRNISMPLRDFATIGENPVFHTLEIYVESAYCEYHFTLYEPSRDDNLNGPMKVLKAGVNCEGKSTTLECEVESERP